MNTTNKPPSGSGPSAVVALRNDQTERRDLTRWLAMGIALTGGAGLLGIAVGGATFVWRPHSKYFSVTPDLRVIPLQALDKPFISEQGLLNWTSTAVCKTLGLDFVHYRDQLLAVQDDYTPDAFKQVINQLQSSGTLNMVKKQRILMSAIPSAPPVIVNEGVVAGRYAWRIQFPVLVSYETTGSSPTKQALVATVMVTRVPTAYNPRGVAITQLNLLQGGGSQ